MEWSLEDVERQTQKKGDLVRLHFILDNPSENSPRAERMWVEVSFEGSESEEYSNDSSNVSVVNINYLIDKDPSLLAPLRGEIGTAFERNDLKSPWIEVKDWLQEEIL